MATVEGFVESVVKGAVSELRNPGVVSLHGKPLNLTTFVLPSGDVCITIAELAVFAASFMTKKDRDAESYASVSQVVNRIAYRDYSDLAKSDPEKWLEYTVNACLFAFYEGTRSELKELASAREGRLEYARHKLARRWVVSWWQMLYEKCTSYSSWIKLVVNSLIALGVMRASRAGRWDTGLALVPLFAAQWRDVRYITAGAYKWLVFASLNPMAPVVAGTLGSYWLNRLYGPRGMYTGVALNVVWALTVGITRRRTALLHTGPGSAVQGSVWNHDHGRMEFAEIEPFTKDVGGHLIRVFQVGDCVIGEVEHPAVATRPLMVLGAAPDVVANPALIPAVLHPAVDGASDAMTVAMAGLGDVGLVPPQVVPLDQEPDGDGVEETKSGDLMSTCGDTESEEEGDAAASGTVPPPAPPAAAGGGLPQPLPPRPTTREAPPAPPVVEEKCPEKHRGVCRMGPVTLECSKHCPVYVWKLARGYKCALIPETAGAPCGWDGAASTSAPPPTADAGESRSSTPWLPPTAPDSPVFEPHSPEMAPRSPSFHVTEDSDSEDVAPPVKIIDPVVRTDGAAHTDLPALERRQTVAALGICPGNTPRPRFAMARVVPVPVNDAIIENFILNRVGMISEYGNALSFCKFPYQHGKPGSLETILNIPRVESLLALGVIPPDCTLTPKQGAPPQDAIPGKYSVIGPLNLNQIPLVWQRSMHNEAVSLTRRHMVPLRDGPAEIAMWERAVRDFMPFIYSQMFAHVRPANQAEWLEGLDATRRKMYSDHIATGHNLLFTDAKDHFRDFFIKSEVMSATKKLDASGHDMGRAFSAPRGIQALAKAVANIALGPYMTALSKGLAESFQVGGIYATFGYTAGRTPEEIGAWYDHMVNAGYKFVENDFSSFDATQGHGAHYAEMSLYEKFPGGPAVQKALARQKFTKGFSMWFCYTLKYTRKSGDQNTSLGNSIINMLFHAYALCSLGVTDYYMLVMGDDNLIAFKAGIPPADLAAGVGAMAHQFGLSSKCEAREFPTFCSGDFMPCRVNGQDTHVLVPLATRRAGKMGVTHYVLPSNVSTLLRMKGNELSCPVNRAMPVSRVFYYFYTAIAGEADREERFEYHAPSTAVVEMNGSTVEWFCRAYGISESELVELEGFLWAHLNATYGYASAWAHPVMERMLAHRG